LADLPFRCLGTLAPLHQVGVVALALMDVVLALMDQVGVQLLHLPLKSRQGRLIACDHVTVCRWRRHGFGRVSAALAGFRGAPLW
jgi:hypothetical protein